MTLSVETFANVPPEILAKHRNEIGVLQKASAEYAAVLANIIPDGPDKTYLLRKLRECMMWGVVAITRNPDGTPRQ